MSFDRLQTLVGSISEHKSICSLVFEGLSIAIHQGGQFLMNLLITTPQTPDGQHPPISYHSGTVKRYYNPSPYR
ncbi:hypothetical protein K435DRAFT_778074 [Dendrothele bispora CBS 962.96]|uniref:Uncharacterized protein n=1 Tax=Dendrothele bispora (strain CBS 962.96) TaxID=1314807 RepID=A0A4S8M5A3_DENBC|nr:hypothetical protein K435DRAFT_778074 [Dendrothele bispora CBS 962.96]